MTSFKKGTLPEKFNKKDWEVRDKTFDFEDKLYSLIEEEVECSKDGKIEKCRWDDIKNLFKAEVAAVLDRVKLEKGEVKELKMSDTARQYYTGGILGYNRAISDLEEVKAKILKSYDL